MVDNLKYSVLEAAQLVNNAEITTNGACYEFEIDGYSFLVGTETESHESARDYQYNFIDECGLSGFSEWFQNDIKRYYLDESFFIECIEEVANSYVDDLRYENDARINSLLDDIRQCENQDEADSLQQEINELENFDYDSERESYIRDCGNPVEYCQFNFGQDWLDEVIKSHGLIDWDTVVDEVLSMDGRGCLAHYDGNEYEYKVYGEYMYIYRMN